MTAATGIFVPNVYIWPNEVEWHVWVMMCHDNTGVLTRSPVSPVSPGPWYSGMSTIQEITPAAANSSSSHDQLWGQFKGWKWMMGNGWLTCYLLCYSTGLVCPFNHFSPMLFLSQNIFFTKYPSIDTKLLVH